LPALTAASSESARTHSNRVAFAVALPAGTDVSAVLKPTTDASIAAPAPVTNFNLLCNHSCPFVGVDHTQTKNANASGLEQRYERTNFAKGVDD